MQTFHKLTKGQHRVFEQIASGNMQDHNPLVISNLVGKGMIVHVGNKLLGRDRFGDITLPMYEVPVFIHLAWCEWCAAQSQ